MALEQIKEVDPALDSKLYNKYFRKFDDYTLNLSEEERAYIKHMQPLTVAIVSNWAPYQYMNKEGQLHGITVDILKTIAERTELEFNFIQTDSYSDAIEMVNSGQADMMAGVSTNAEEFRESDIKITQPYLSFHKVLIMNKNSDISKDSVYAATPNNDFLRDENAEHVIYYETVQECVEAVNNGDADYTFSSQYSLEYIVANNTYRNIAITTLYDSVESMHIGINRAYDVKLQTILNKAIRSISESEESTIVLNNSL